jgi:hypothetical protein
MKISQREARRLKKRVEDLERQQNLQRAVWNNSYPGGVHLGYLTLTADWFRGRLEASRMLGHPIVVTLDGAKANFYAVK